MPDSEAAVLDRFSRANAVALPLAAGCALALGVAWPLVLAAALSFAWLVRLGRGRYTPRGGFGLGNGVTIVRSGLASSVGLLPRAVPNAALGAIVLTVFALDGLDGWVAQRRGETSSFGAHLDMETDAYFVLLLGVTLLERGRFGPWLLATGLLRYAYVLTVSLVPSRGPVPRSRLGRHAFTALMLGVIAGLWSDAPLGTAAAAMGAALVAASFVHSFFWSYTSEDGWLAYLTRRVAFLGGHALLSVAFVASRLTLHAAGLRMNFELTWMWLADPADLRRQLLHTLLYFHAFPPGMNVLTAVCLALGGAHPAGVALALFWAFDLLLVNCLYGLARGMRLASGPAFLLALGFSLSPPALYFEHLWLYECPIVSLLTASAFLFLRALRAPSPGRWLAFFACAACIGLTRSTFHLIWFAALVGLALLLCARGTRRRVLAGAIAPALLLTSLYAKNWVVFGFFDAFSEGPLNLNLITTSQLPPAQRAAWIAEGRLSRYAAVDVFAGPREYLRFFPRARNPAYPPELSELERPSNGARNYNHWVYLLTRAPRRHDAFVYVRERPFAYLGTVERGLTSFFSATTRWHPGEGRGPTPHDQVRGILGPYEDAYNGVLHGLLVPPVGLYVFLPLLLAWTAVRARALFRASDPASRARAGLLVFVLVQTAYVTSASVLFTTREESRYRYQIEPFIWLLVALAIHDLARRFRRSPAPPASKTTVDPGAAA